MNECDPSQECAPALAAATAKEGDPLYVAPDRYGKTEISAEDRIDPLSTREPGEQTMPGMRTALCSAIL